MKMTVLCDHWHFRFASQIVSQRPPYSAIGIQYIARQNNHYRELFLQTVAPPSLKASCSFVSINFVEVTGMDVCRIDVAPSRVPVYVDAKDDAGFNVRLNT